MKRFLAIFQLARHIARAAGQLKKLPIGGDTDLPPVRLRVEGKRYQFDVHATRLD